MNRGGTEGAKRGKRKWARNKAVGIRCGRWVAAQRDTDRIQCGFTASKGSKSSAGAPCGPGCVNVCWCWGIVCKPNRKFVIRAIGCEN